MSVEGGVTKYFAWAGGQIIAEYEASGANALIWKTSYVYLGGRLLATTSGIDGTETRFHHPDRLGTRLVTDAGGTVVSEQWTLPFGNMQPFTSVPGGENPYQNPTLSNPSKKRFTSYDRSEATKLDYAVNRFYSPQQGRFTQVDPIGMSAASLSDPQTLNMYAYCGNDPINRVDPDGLLWGWVKGLFKFVTFGIWGFKAVRQAGLNVLQAGLKVLSNKWVRLAIAVALAILSPPAGMIIWNFSAAAQATANAVSGLLAGLQAVGAVSDLATGLKKKPKTRRGKSKTTFIILKAVIFIDVRVHEISAGRPEDVRRAKFFNCLDDADTIYRGEVRDLVKRYDGKLGPTSIDAYEDNLWGAGLGALLKRGVQGAGAGYAASIGGSVIGGWRRHGEEYLRETEAISNRYKNALSKCKYK